MSFTMNNTGHDTHLYDKERHDNQIVAVYEDDAAAGRARDALLAAGVPHGAIQVRNAPQASAPKPESTGDQVIGAFMSLFSSSDEAHFEHALGRGHAMVVVTPGGDIDRRRMIAVLEQSHPIDFDAKLEEWRQAGYEGMEAQNSSERPAGQRETLAGGSRVRSYVAERPSSMGTGGDVTNATPGAQSSGMNAPRSAS